MACKNRNVLIHGGMQKPPRAWTSLASPLGDVVLVSTDTALESVTFASATRDADLVRADRHPILDEARYQLSQYFQAERRCFDLPLSLRGTAFQRACWDSLLRIPYGETRSYAQQASALGDARKARAVGAANGSNPWAIVIPCHRVVASDGKLGGYAGGVAIKQLLLELEARQAGNARGQRVLGLHDLNVVGRASLTASARGFNSTP
jgi:methylated-DNA-[protein]-cysteine S-methyltransferase